jgi:amino acid transporter
MPSKDLTVGIFGLMQGMHASLSSSVLLLIFTGVYAYAGAQLFVEFMAELRRPRDFLKAMWGAQFFIYSCYMIYGCYTYFWQGQYSYQVCPKDSDPIAKDELIRT